MGGGKRNPRQDAGRARKRAAMRYAAADAPCALCGGRRGPIDYTAPRNHMFPLSLAIDERVPVSRWREGGYSSARECACDESNWQPAHWVCNSMAGDKRGRKSKLPAIARDVPSGAF